VAGADGRPDRVGGRSGHADGGSAPIPVPRILSAAAGPLLDRVRPALEGLVPPVVVACSGGTDSLALLALAAAAGLQPVAVHVDHGARPGSEAESQMVAALAAALGTAFSGERVEVALGPGFEARAREARYDALERARVRLGATAILVGHTRDDQAETVLLNLLRGGAVTGLAGIPARRGTLVRPLLEIPRAELAELCARLGLSPFEDPMNADPSYRRVWVRREVIPELEKGAGRDLRAVLARQAALARADSELLAGLAAEALEAAGAGPAGQDPWAAEIAALPPALGRRAVRLWLDSPPPALEHVDAVLEVARGDRRAVDLPGGLRVLRSGGRLCRVEAGDLPGLGSSPPVAVDLPGQSEGFGLRLEAWVERAAPLRWPDGRWTAVLDADRAGPAAVLRPPRPGERFAPLGLGGKHKAVADALAEAGVPAEARSGHPVLAATGPAGEALWVLGYRIDHCVRVTGDTRRFLWVTAEQGGRR
jgi:tRNA(Ile)-lysidine synthase